jgi:Flp pilus assembly protein TadG
MKSTPLLLGADRCGVAAVEFAIIAPLLLLLLGGMADFGLLIAGRSQLANGLAQGVQHALQRGPAVSAAAVENIVSEGSLLAGVKSSLNVVVTGPACYCASGSPTSLSPSEPALTENLTCPGTCPLAAGTTSPGIYLIIDVTYNFQPLMPLYSRLASPVSRQKVTARLQ